ncbi:hypothetical protein [Ralstonia pickettii]|jgi:hypothetical protein|uniref:hypothetical protein n=1 Tax=Ralstonia pickettii TaxID=329 RepID=UPI0015F98D75|nr:hypothetical protein [Ralstonia pickettii]MBX4004188.1 hypothetical protein [Ralstonia pickettii]MBX4030907.1 hypothetical protein [Ralstonia pickettii]MBX4072624.1 hypothetical protein [Ralstonia pickettii]MBX4077486.1 hypothetical protein [Ralstonia pickettii]MBX4090586.1 hypothetical protein [Ralstonia pickettii]
MQADLEVLRNLRIARVTADKTHSVRLVDIPQPFRAEFRAWMFLGRRPGIEGEGWWPPFSCCCRHASPSVQAIPDSARSGSDWPGSGGDGMVHHAKPVKLTL